MYKINKLKSGLEILTCPVRGAKTVTALVMVATGSKYENKHNNGISHFLEHMFFKGSKHYPTTRDISSELDGLGAEYNAFTGKEYTGYWVKTDSAKIGRGMSIIFDMLGRPLLKQAEIDREKGVIAEEYNMYQDNPMYYIEEVFENCLYGNTPAGWDTLGTLKNIKNFKRKDFSSYLRAQYGPANTVVCLAGNLSRMAGIKKYIEKQLASTDLLKRGRGFIQKEEVVEKQKRAKTKVHFKKTDQAHISLGVRTFGYAHEDKMIAKFLGIILGGSMSSRMFSSLRERSGLAYYVRTDSEFYSDSGYLTTRAGVPVDKTEQAIDIILKEYKKIRQKGVLPAELNRNKEMLMGRLALQLESSDQLANWYARQVVLAKTVKRENDIEAAVMDPKQYLKIIKNIKALDLSRVASDIFQNDRLNLAVIGPFKGEKRFEVGI